MQNSSLGSHGLNRTLIVLMPGLSTLLTIACVLAFRVAPESWRSGPIESIVGTVLVSVSALSFLALCKYASSEAGQ